MTLALRKVVGKSRGEADLGQQRGRPCARRSGRHVTAEDRERVDLVLVVESGAVELPRQVGDVGEQHLRAAARQRLDDLRLCVTAEFLRDAEFAAASVVPLEQPAAQHLVDHRAARRGAHSELLDERLELDQCTFGGLAFDAGEHACRSVAQPLRIEAEIDFLREERDRSHRSSRATIAGDDTSIAAAVFHRAPRKNASALNGMDASHILWIATANDDTAIPDPILNRMNVYEIARPDAEGSRRIALSVYREILDQHRWPFPPEPSEDVLDRLATIPARDMRKLLLDAFGNAQLAGRDQLVAEDIDAKKLCGRRARVGF